MSRFSSAKPLCAAAAAAVMLAASLSRAQAQNVNSFHASAVGLGWLFQYQHAVSSPSPASGWTSLTTSNQSVQLNGNSGAAFYMVGFNEAAPDNAPPAYLTLDENAGDLGSMGQTIRVTGISSVFIVDPNGTQLSGSATTNGASLYQGVPSTPTSSSQAGWFVANASATSDHYFGYHDETGPGGAGSGFQTSNFLGHGAPPYSASNPTYGVFDFTNWSAGSNNVYLGMDVQTDTGKTGRVYITDFATSTQGEPTPEPAFYQLAGLLGLGGIGMLRLRRPARHLAV